MGGGRDRAAAERGSDQRSRSFGAFRYFRLREPPYDDSALRAWAERIRPLLGEGIDVYVFFKHEEEPSAPRYAERLLGLLSA